MGAGTVFRDYLTMDKKIADKKIADKKIADKKIADKRIADKRIAIVSPIDGRMVAERDLSSDRKINHTLEGAVRAQKAWRKTPISERAAFCLQAIDVMVTHRDELGEELTWQMGRPIQVAPAEILGLEARGRYMIGIAEQELADIGLPEKDGSTRFIRREPLGVVCTIAPWNYPYLTAVNSIIPALMAGNAVILKHSAQTLLCAERFQQAFDEAGLPEGVFQYLHLDHKTTAQLIRHPDIAFVSFTGSVAGGGIIEQCAAGLFKGLALELGGKDPAYVREDALLAHAVSKLVEGAYFNSGQSCCGIERIYVHQNIYSDFVEAYVATVKQYRLGNPLDPLTTLGPMVSGQAADSVRTQIAQASAAGATPCIDASCFKTDREGSPYLAPQVLIDVDHSMTVMQEESFGPVVGIMKVGDDQEALDLMNDSPFGLTASIWTRDENRATALGDRLQTGTVFMNRCDYLDPALAWGGVKQSGRGCALSILGYQQLTRPKSFHLRSVR
ncbi:MAG: aldehyde dehydrogenase family protein [Nitrospiria bacterium]